MTGSKIIRFPFSSNSAKQLATIEPKLANWPVVYTIRNSSQIYVGETTSAEMRMRQHAESASKRELEEVSVILDETFNKSACLDLESQLIKYFFADEKFEVLNGNSGIMESDYFDRDRYQKTFDRIFGLLCEQGVLTRSVPELVNSDFFKYSPFKSLNNEQSAAVTDILENLLINIKRAVGATFVVQGSPGTGKTIVAIYLMKLIADLKRLDESEAPSEESQFHEFFFGANRELAFKLENCALVIPQLSLRASIKKVFKKTPGLSEKMVLTPFELGKSASRFDLVIVDEAHRLQQRANQSSAVLNKQYREINLALFGKDDLNKTQLDWVMAKSNHQILLIDTAQAVKPADLPSEVLEREVEIASLNKNFFSLSNQMRVLGGDDYIRFIGDFLAGQADKSPHFEGYDLRVFEDVREMRDEIIRLDEEFGLSRMVAGFAWPWVSKKSPAKPDIHIDGLELFWNQTAQDWINAKNSVNEVGSIHTVQGYDLNYAGVIIGSDLSYDPETETFKFNRDNYHDVKGKENNTTLGIKYSDDELLEFVKNIYRVLLTRGIRGTFIYAVDPGLMQLLRNTLKS